MLAVYRLRSLGVIDCWIFLIMYFRDREYGVALRIPRVSSAHRQLDCSVCVHVDLAKLGYQVAVSIIGAGVSRKFARSSVSVGLGRPIKQVSALIVMKD